MDLANMRDFGSVESRQVGEDIATERKQNACQLSVPDPGDVFDAWGSVIGRPNYGP
jgi:hypothetical protein